MFIAIGCSSGATGGGGGGGVHRGPMGREEGGNSGLGATARWGDGGNSGGVNSGGVFNL